MAPSEEVRRWTIADLDGDATDVWSVRPPRVPKAPNCCYREVDKFAAGNVCRAVKFSWWSRLKAIARVVRGGSLSAWGLRRMHDNASYRWAFLLVPDRPLPRHRASRPAAGASWGSGGASSPRRVSTERLSDRATERQGDQSRDSSGRPPDTPAGPCPTEMRHRPRRWLPIG